MDMQVTVSPRGDEMQMGQDQTGFVHIGRCHELHEKDVQPRSQIKETLSIVGP